MDIYTWTTDTMLRKKIHPGWNCGPCVLCGQTSYQYCAHPIRWSDSLRENFLALKDIEVSSCICRNCEKDIKNCIENQLYVPCWKEKENICNKKCIVPICFCMSNITTTNICTVLEVATMLGFTIDDLDDTQAVVTLCKSHYRQVYCIVHSNDDMYVHIKPIQCYTCNAKIKHGTARQCPDSKAIAEHYLVHYGSDLSFTPDHSICKICYNIYSAILRRLQSCSLDEELHHLLSNDEPLLPEVKNMDII